MHLIYMKFQLPYCFPRFKLDCPSHWTLYMYSENGRHGSIGRSSSSGLYRDELFLTVVPVVAATRFSQRRWRFWALGFHCFRSSRRRGIVVWSCWGLISWFLETDSAVLFDGVTDGTDHSSDLFVIGSVISSRPISYFASDNHVRSSVGDVEFSHSLPLAR